MALNAYLAREKVRAFEGVQAGRVEAGFRGDEARLAELSGRGEPTMGTTVLHPDRIVFEFIFSLEGGESEVFALEHEPAERIVFLPVPGWVVESIWQGEVQGSYVFESEARVALAEFQAALEPAENAKLFGPQQPKRRE
jgi:hypothetical protein